MGKVELKFDDELIRKAEAVGVEPVRAAEQGIREAIARAPQKGRAGSSDAESRACEWAERNRGAIDEYNQHVREHGLLSDQEPFVPRWMR